jgi:hypothetical protein
VDIGGGGIKAIGLAWLVLSVLFVVAAGATLMRTKWWQPFVYTAVGIVDGAVRCRMARADRPVENGLGRARRAGVIDLQSV